VISPKFCVQCHGSGGQGDGAVAQNPKWPGPPPAYDSPQLKDLPEGKIFFSITYGRNLMGPHASQINQEDRWKLVRYVQTLQDKDAMEKYNNKGATEEEQVSEEADSETPSEGESEATGETES